MGRIKLVEYAKARYKAKISSWTLRELYEIDKIFYAFYTKATKNMKTFSNDLLYLNKERDGVGLTWFLDTVSIDKLAELLRAYQRGDHVEAAVNGHLQRTLRHQGLNLQERSKVNIRPAAYKNHWLRSILEWLQKHNLYLWRGGNI